MKRCTDGYRGLKQGRVKMMDGPAVTRGALGKHGHPISLRKRGAHDLVQAARVAAACALDEERTSSLAKNTHQRPVANFRFRDESRRAHDVDHKDVEPGYVVRGKECGHGTVERRGALCIDPKSEACQHPGAPSLHHAKPRKVRNKWIDEPHTQQPLHEEEHEPCETPTTNRKRGSSGAHSFRKCFR
jgi:hypothetical protein